MSFILNAAGQKDCAVVAICNLYRFFNIKHDVDTIIKDIGYCIYGTEGSRIVNHLYKNFDVFWFGGETAQFQFRTEFHNITNNANFSRLSVGTSSPSFAAFTQALPGRQIQLGLRLIW